MKDKILAVYRKLKPEVRAGLCDLVARLTWAADHDPEIVAALISRPSELATIERYADDVAAAYDELIAQLSQN
jgi:hypothetical protein